MPIARPSATPVRKAWQNLLPSLPWTLGALVSLSCTQAPMVAQGVMACDKSACIPNSLFFCHCHIIRLMPYALYFCLLGLLTLGAVPNNCTNNLCPVPLWPPPAPFTIPAATPQHEFWLPVVVQRTLTLAVPRSSLTP